MMRRRLLSRREMMERVLLQTELQESRCSHKREGCKAEKEQGRAARKMKTTTMMNTLALAQFLVFLSAEM